MSNASDPFRKILTTEAENYAKSNNINLKVMDAPGSVEAQVSQMKEAAGKLQAEYVIDFYKGKKI